MLNMYTQIVQCIYVVCLYVQVQTTNSLEIVSYALAQERTRVRALNENVQPRPLKRWISRTNGKLSQCIYSSTCIIQPHPQIAQMAQITAKRFARIPAGSSSCATSSNMRWMWNNYSAAKPDAPEYRTNMWQICGTHHIYYLSMSLSLSRFSHWMRKHGISVLQIVLFVSNRHNSPRWAR